MARHDAKAWIDSSLGSCSDVNQLDKLQFALFSPPSRVKHLHRRWQGLLDWLHSVPFVLAIKAFTLPHDLIFLGVKGPDYTNFGTKTVRTRHQSVL